MKKNSDKQTTISWLRNFLVGGIMGIANIIPGVSGGTIAVVFGIFEELMEALGNFITDKENRWKYIRFLVTVFGGAIITIIIFARVLTWAFENYTLMTVYFFLGLILGSIPVVVKSHKDMSISISRIISFSISFIVVIILALLQTGDKQAGGQELSFSTIGIFDYLYYTFCGAISASAMIIPGISGSFILILLGIYWDILASLNGLTSTLFDSGLTPDMTVRLVLLGSLGVGIVIGILVFSRFMSWALKQYPSITLYAIIGLIIGSVYQIFPGFEFNMNGIGAVFTFVVGVVISLKFGEEKKKI